MNMLKNRLLFGFLIYITSFAFSQQPIDTLEIKIGREVKVFTTKVKIISIESKKTVSLTDNNYLIENKIQKANIQIVNKLINGTLFINEKENDSTNYTIKNSVVTDFKMYENGTLVFDSYQKDKKAYYKRYRADNTLESEAWISLDEQKMFGAGVTKKYSPQGIIVEIDDRVLGYFTEFHPNGNKKSRNGRGVYEQYNKDGILFNKQYSKNNTLYYDIYENGKLYTSSYKNESDEEVTEYYKAGIFEKKEIIKKTNGETFIYTYDKTGKLMSKIPHQFPGIASPVE